MLFYPQWEPNFSVMTDKEQEWLTWKKMMANKRTGKQEEKKNLGQINLIMVQKMNPKLTG